jgi:hypothetical protein
MSTNPRPLSRATIGSSSGSAYGAYRRIAKCAIRNKPVYASAYLARSSVIFCSWLASTSRSETVVMMTAKPRSSSSTFRRVDWTGAGAKPPGGLGKAVPAAALDDIS